MNPGPDSHVVSALAAVSTTIAALAFRSSLAKPFLLFDAAQIGGDPALRSLWPVWAPLLSALGLPVQPFPYYTFAFKYALHGLRPFGWYATNVPLHLANGLHGAGCVARVYGAAVVQGRCALPAVGIGLSARAVATV